MVDAYRPDTRDFRFDVEQRTRSVNFTDQPLLEDTPVSAVCVGVFTSDGVRGTISHLIPDQDTELFAADLRKKTGIRGVSVCLIGGVSSSEPNFTIFPIILARDLRDAGFNVASAWNPSNDLLGYYHRRSTLFPDRVEVQRASMRGVHEPQTKTLYFPR